MMANFAESSTEASFKCLGGMLAIKIDRLPAATGTVTVTANTAICGGNTVNNESVDTPVFGDFSDENAKAVTFNYSGATAMQPGVFYRPLPAATYTGLTVKVSGTGDNGELTSTTTTTKEIAVEKGHIKKLKVNTDYSKEIDGHQMIDLGLASGLLWADANVGATTSTEVGKYFAWAETTENTTYDGSKYSGWTKYGSDGKTELEAEDDAATQNWGPRFRMPSTADVDELILGTTQTKVTNDASTFTGYTFTSNTNGRSIFLPVTGYKDRAVTVGAVTTDRGVYWTSMMSSTADYVNAYALVFTSDGVSGTGMVGRPYGCVVRAVAKP